jgi:hypothetical protein
MACSALRTRARALSAKLCTSPISRLLSVDPQIFVHFRLAASTRRKCPCSELHYCAEFCRISCFQLLTTSVSRASMVHQLPPVPLTAYVHLHVCPRSTRDGVAGPEEGVHLIQAYVKRTGRKHMAMHSPRPRKKRKKAPEMQWLSLTRTHYTSLALRSALPV